MSLFAIEPRLISFSTTIKLIRDISIAGEIFESFDVNNARK